ncbi:MAG: AgmX/PglI C-terminal domain-containing protein [Chitinispirillaceae bacterium]|nr:AgmX/PglI C-terminal domain-containing protein [Chitinispirillaceae bacterium]
MHRISVLYAAIPTVAVVLLLLCGKRADERTVVQLGNDSLGLETIRQLVPDGVNDSLKIKKVICRLALSNTLSPERKVPGDIADKCARKLSLISGKDCSVQSAEKLLEASSALAGALKNSKGVVGYLDSLAATIKPTVRGQPVSCALDEEDRAVLQRLPANDEAELEQIIMVVLKVTEDFATTLASFVRHKDVEDAGNVKAMVKGLIADTAAAPTIRAEKRKPALSSARALAFRSQESIRDSIAKHLVNLQQLYKRHLKTGDYASGTVWVTFRVGWEGRVNDARITRSAIKNQQFLERFGQYLRIIKFKEVPQSAGTMTFEFPFEFKAEE